MQDMEQMQSSMHDYLTGLIIPKLLKTLQHVPLSGYEQDAEALLQNWNGNMDVNSPAASIWWTFWTRYLTDTFNPWWQADHVPITQHPELTVSPNQPPLDEDLETWTLKDPTNAAFNLPDGTKRDAGTVMLQAFKETVGELTQKLGNDPMQWQWGKLHSRKILSLLGVNALSYGPLNSGGDTWTLNSVSGNPVSKNNPILLPSSHGPSWRMIVDWGNGQTEGVYPGGQDENTASPWYENEITKWWNGQYYPMINGSTAHKQPGSFTWTLSN
jgi:penicillin G amidase